MSEKKFIMTIAGQQIECGGSIAVDEKMEALNENLNILWDMPMIYARGQYTDQSGKTIEFESMAATELTAMFLAGQIAQMEIYKTWAENE